jgi:hypothetical protein
VTPHVLPLDAPHDSIKALVVEWSELLAAGRFADALAMFPTADPSWAPQLLEKTIAGYGVPGYPDKVAHVITTLRGRPDADEIIRTKIRVNRDALYGLDPARYLGMVHYDDVPLDGERSDLTARFHIRRVGTDGLTLEFLDIHVM